MGLKPDFLFRTLAALAVVMGTVTNVQAASLMAGAAKIDITSEKVKLNNDRMYAKALVIQNNDTKIVLITVDAVAIGEIGSIKNDYLGNVRAALEKDLKIKPMNVMINASHCHGIICDDVAERTVKVVKQAVQKLEPVHVGTGSGHEDRIMENRRLKMRSGKEIDIRHAYSLPPDNKVASIGPIDPQIGILRLDRANGETLAVVYNFACHPIHGVPNKGNTADMTGFASQVIEDNLSKDTIALFVQGCAGDINPVMYKHVDKPRDAEPLGNMLGLSTLKAVRKIKCAEQAALKYINAPLSLPRADFTKRIANLEAEQQRLLKTLGGTSLNLKTFVPLFVKYHLHEDFPSYYSHSYLNEKKLGRDGLLQLDAENRRNMQAYITNIYTMEELSRQNVNLRLLRKNQAKNVATGKRTIDVEVVALRVGDFVLITFPGELTVQIGLNIKKHSPHKHTFVAGYTNGYIYYAPTTEQARNIGAAQEDSDCLLAPEWQKQFEDKVQELLNKL